MNTIYQTYRTRTFGQIFPSAEDFVASYKASGLSPQNNRITDESAATLFYLLYGRYGTSHIANHRDENQFVYELFSIVFSYGPTWEKNLELQNALREASINDLAKGATQVYNKALNPDTLPTQSAMEELPYISEQNTANHRRSLLETYANLSALLDSDLSNEFIGKFARLFIKSAATGEILLYTEYPLNTSGDELVIEE